MALFACEPEEVWEVFTLVFVFGGPAREALSESGGIGALLRF